MMMITVEQVQNYTWKAGAQILVKYTANEKESH